MSADAEGARTLTIDEAMLLLREQFAQKRAGKRLTLAAIRESFIEYCRAKEGGKPASP